MHHKAVFVALIGLVGCGPGPSEDPGDRAGEVTRSDLTACFCQNPTAGLHAKFQIGKETYQQQITDRTAIEDAIALWQGKSTRHIPAGTLRCNECRGWNCQWGWHVDPASIHFASYAIELCDGTPSYLQTHCSSFGPTYCPWQARLVELRDCRRPDCAPVPR
jgi:hypothetical protein